MDETSVNLNDKSAQNKETIAVNNSVPGHLYGICYINENITDQRT